MQRIESMLARPVAALILIGAAALAGCGSDAPQPKAPTPAPVANAAKPGPAAGAKEDVATPTSGSVQIEDKILKACGDIPEARFAFDSAAIAGQAEAALSALAKCFVSGPLKGKGMKLVGHTDPRGTETYNRGLGQRRAGSVASFLNAKGLEPSRVATSSAGEDEATGTDDEGWAKDRKVDVFLAE